MKIIIMHQTVAKHDAIGNDIELMYQLIRDKYECKVYAQNQFNNNVEYISYEDINNELNDLSNIIIYHHSVYWEKGEEILDRFKGKVIIRYHNITPAEFFEPFNEFHFSQCSLGRNQTLRIAEKYTKAFWMVDSLYNAEDIKAIVERERIGVCPPFNKIEQWAEGNPDETILKELLLNQKINVLFVGRVAPNKGHMFLMDILKDYCANYGNNIKLNVIGKFDEGIIGYNNLLLQKIDQYGITECVEFIGEITDSILMSYYLGSDVFVCVSDHEGFCVPIPEAQFFELPIIAKETCAVPETIGHNQVLLGNDSKEYAAAIHIISKNQTAKDFLRKSGKDNFINRFTHSKIKECFKENMKNAINIDL